MGLDMTLVKKELIWGNVYDKESQDFKNRRIEVKVVEPNGTEQVKVYDEGKTVEIAVSQLYWRKFNALHKWFVDNCADGEDDCKPVYVDCSMLRELYKIILRLKNELKLVDGKVENGYTFNEAGEKVYDYVDGKLIENKELAEELLPCSEGFFFGSTQYNEWYYDDVVRTEEMLRELIEDEDFEKYDYYYEASW